MKRVIGRSLAAVSVVAVLLSAGLAGCENKTETKAPAKSAAPAAPAEKK